MNFSKVYSLRYRDPLFFVMNQYEDLCGSKGQYQQLTNKLKSLLDDGETGSALSQRPWPR